MRIIAMFTLPHSAVRATAIAVLLGSTALAVPSFVSAAPLNTTSPSNVVAQSDSSTDGTAAPAGSMKMKGKMTPDQMKQNVELRIKTLHDKLQITPDQEDAWNTVAQAMRDSETSTSNLIMQRHKGAATMTAVEDLQSYQSIAQSHADGLKNVISAFSTLYDNMSDDQKKNADTVFGTFEGHMGDHHGKLKSKSM
jgi:hypothetical protein